MLIYGEKRETAWIEEALSDFTVGLRDKAEFIKAVYVDEFIYKSGDGNVFPDNISLSRPSEGNLIFNRSTLSKELLAFKKKYGPVTSETFDLYERIIKLTGERWVSAFYHEFFHVIDASLSPEPEKHRYLSETPGSPFLKPEAHRITPWAESFSIPHESAAETFKLLMMKKRETGDFFNPGLFMLKLYFTPYGEQYRFLLTRYFTDKEEKLAWPMKKQGPVSNTSGEGV